MAQQNRSLLQMLPALRQSLAQCAAQVMWSKLAGDGRTRDTMRTVLNVLPGRTISAS